MEIADEIESLPGIIRLPRELSQAAGSGLYSGLVGLAQNFSDRPIDMNGADEAQRRMMENIAARAGEGLTPESVAVTAPLLFTAKPETVTLPVLVAFPAE